ncbi:hypothetical protein R6Z07F_006456 [Ovis aries]
MLTPAFHFNILKSYMKIFTKSADIMHHLIKKGHTHLDMFERISLMTLDSLQKGVFSFNSNCQEKPSEYIATFLELSALVAKGNQQIFLHMDFLGLALVHGCTDVVIQKQRWPLLSESVDDFLKVKVKTKTLDFIDVLLLTKSSLVLKTQDGAPGIIPISASKPPPSPSIPPPTFTATPTRLGPPRAQAPPAGSR